MRQLLIPEKNNLVFDERIVNGCELTIAQGFPEIDPENLGADAPRQWFTSMASDVMT